MTVTAVQIRSAAALLGAVPGLTARLTFGMADARVGLAAASPGAPAAVHSEASVPTLVAGAADDATMCGHTFRELVLAHHLHGEHLAGAHLTLDEADPATGLIVRGRVRWFVSPLPGPLTTATVREAGHTRAPLQSVVRADADLGVSVVAVRDRSGAVDGADLDLAATGASAACLVTHLLATAGLDPVPTRTTHP